MDKPLTERDKLVWDDEYRMYREEMQGLRAWAGEYQRMITVWEETIAQGGGEKEMVRWKEALAAQLKGLEQGRASMMSL